MNLWNIKTNTQSNPDSTPQIPTQTATTNSTQNTDDHTKPSSSFIQKIGEIKPAVPQNSAFARIDVSISGTTHRISCPSDEVDSVRQTAQQLHQNILKLRQEVTGKSPSNEELLVLHCLELYDQINELKTTQKFANDKEQRSQLALDKLLKTAKGMVK